MKRELFTFKNIEKAFLKVKEEEPTPTEEQEKENLKILYNLLKSKINNYIEIVDDIEYYNNFIDGIIIYFPNGETFQIFKDINNKISQDNSIIVLNENLSILYKSTNILYIINNIIESVEEKNNIIKDNDNNNRYVNLKFRG